MRSFLRLIAIAIIVFVCGVIGFAALFNEPPEPYVRIDDHRVAPLYLSRIECVNGREVQTYRREGGEEIPPVLTERAC